MPNELESVARAGEHVTEGLSTLVTLAAKFLGPPAEELGGMLGDQLASWRYANAVRILESAEARLEKSDTSRHQIDPKFFFPFIERASLEDNETLSELWVGLLTSAATKDVERAGYTRILSDLEVLDAKILDRLCRGARLRSLKPTATSSRWCEELEVTEEELRLSFQFLKNLGLVEVNDMADLDGRRIDTEWHPTTLGRDFWMACQGRPMTMEIVNPGPS